MPNPTNPAWTPIAEDPASSTLQQGLSDADYLQGIGDQLRAAGHSDDNVQAIQDFIRSRPIGHASDPFAQYADAPAIGDEVPQGWFARNAPDASSSAPPIGADVSSWFAQNAPGKANANDPSKLPTKPFSPDDFTQPGPQGSAVGRFARNLGSALNPITALEGGAAALLHPIDTAKGLLAAQVNEGRKAIADAKAGRKIEGMGHAAAALLPLLGPAAAAAGEQIGTGDVAGGLGKAVATIAPLVAGDVLPDSVSTPTLKNPNPAAAEAVQAAQDAGVPVSAATATGNRAIAAIQHLADRSLAGSVIAGKAARAEQAGMASMGEQLAGKGYALPQTFEDAGDAVRAGIQDQVTGHSGLADDAYDLLRQHEANPANAKVVTMPDGSRQMMPLPVDLTDAKTALQPLYDNLSRQAQLTPAAMLGDKATALRALDTIVNGPDNAPLSVVDSALSDLKRFTRTNPGELRTGGQGTVLQAQNALDSAVKATASDAGPDVLSALQEGRKATVAKYQAQGVLDSLGNSGSVNAIRKLTAPGDANIDKLWAVAQQAPDALPQIGRAFLDDLMGQATQDGGFSRARSIQNQWQKLGTQNQTDAVSGSLVPQVAG